MLGASHVALMLNNPRASAGDQETRVRLPGQEDPLE